MKLTLPNGIVLDSNGGWAKGATDYARQKGITDITCFLSVKDDDEEYVLIESRDGESKPIYANKSYEHIASYIDIIKLDQDFEEQV